MQARQLTVAGHACRRPHFLLVQKVSKDTPGRGKIQNLSPLPGPCLRMPVPQLSCATGNKSSQPTGLLCPHSNWSRSDLLDNSPRIGSLQPLSFTFSFRFLSRGLTLAPCFSITQDFLLEFSITLKKGLVKTGKSAILTL